MTRPKTHIKKDDRVEIIHGKDIGKTGKVLEVFPREGRVIVEGVNIIFRHTRPSEDNPQGGIVENEGPVDISNVQLICDNCGERARTGKKVLDDGFKQRYCKKCGEIIDH